MLKGTRCIWLTPGTTKKVPTQDCLACARRGGNPCGYPLPVIQQVLTDRDPEVVQCSATMIAGCAREQGLKKHLEWFVNPEEAYTRAHGSLLHLGAEHRTEKMRGILTEHRLSHPFQLRDGRTVTVTAQIDIAHADGIGTGLWSEVSIVDYKTVSSLAPSKLRTKVKAYIPQLSIQRWLFEQEGNWVNNVSLVFMTHENRRVVQYAVRDMPAAQALPPSEDYPEAVLMTLEETEAYLQERLPALANSLAEDYADPLPPSEGWRCRRCDVRSQCEALYGRPLPGLGGAWPPHGSAFVGGNR